MIQSLSDAYNQAPPFSQLIPAVSFDQPKDDGP